MSKKISDKMSLVKPTITFKQNSLKYGVPWSQNLSKIHVGADLDRDAPGTKVFSIKRGTVKHVNVTKGWDGVVCVEHTSDDGKNKYTSTYWHLEQIGVKVGQKVNTGQQLGVIGRNNGINKYHDHLHFSIRYAPYDPITSLLGAVDKNKFPGQWRDPTKFVLENLK
jgi:murein DD-endopeptidase MepM/ murein hydrolase activator NlpD